MEFVQAPRVQQDLGQEVSVVLRAPSAEVTLNAICPYFTMFPLDFPLGILSHRAKEGDSVLDPFCGRGTTNFAARLSGLPSLGVDSSPVATAVTAAKLVTTTPSMIVRSAREILENFEPRNMPRGEFWERAYDRKVLSGLCRIREALIEDCRSSSRIALRGIMLGALHGPRQKTFPSYFSNQCPRTYAPKPAYAVNYWRRNRLDPVRMDVLELIARRAERFYRCNSHALLGEVQLADSRHADAFIAHSRRRRFDWVITSPPYYGMKTYIPDQWLRNWFVGGSDVVDYSAESQIAHGGPEQFTRDLRRVWINASKVCGRQARMVIRFGGIRDRHVDPVEIAKASLTGSGWYIETVKVAGTALDGKRQADSFLRASSRPLVEYDIWARN